MFPSSRLCFNCSDAAMNILIYSRGGTVSAAGPQGQLSRNTTLILLSDLRGTGSCLMEKMFSALPSGQRASLQWRPVTVRRSRPPQLTPRPSQDQHQTEMRRKL